MLDERLQALRIEAKKVNEPILRDKSLEILLKITKEKQPKHILEIGTSVGLTGVALLLECKNAKLTGIEISDEKVEIAKRNYKAFDVDKRAKIHLGDANEIVPLLDGEYDLIFLDGPKGHYDEYLEYVLPMLTVGGILFADDILFHGYIKGETPRKHRKIKKSINAFLDVITNSENLKTQVLEIEDGITITEKIK